MYPAAIDEYFAPASVADALDLIQRYGENGKLIAGGQSLLPMMKLRFVRPTCLIDLNRLSGSDGEELRGIRVRDDRVEVGALARHADLIENPLIGEHLPVLARAARGVADFQVRNWGTIGGSLVHADHAADYPPLTLALAATLELRSAAGGRKVPADEFFLGTLQTALRADELLTVITFPLPPHASAGAYVKHSAVAGDFAIANACTFVAVDSQGQVSSARVAVGGVLPTPMLAARAAAALLNGAEPEEAGRVAAEEVPSFNDTRATADFRSVLIGAAVAQTAREALEEARRRAGHGA